MPSIQLVSRRALLALVVRCGILWRHTGQASRGLLNPAPVRLADLFRSQEVATIALHAVAISIAGPAIWTTTSCAVKSPALEPFRQLIAKIASIALIMGSSLSSLNTDLASSLWTLTAFPGFAS